LWLIRLLVKGAARFSARTLVLVTAVVPLATAATITVVWLRNN
jgi:hypothetical protein